MKQAEAKLIRRIEGARDNPELVQRCLWEASRKGQVETLELGADPNRPSPVSGAARIQCISGK